MDKLKSRCGHDCSRCKVYAATQTGDKKLRKEVIAFYKTAMGRKLKTADVHCNGCRSDDKMTDCGDCPFTICCDEKGLDSCVHCPKPCDMYIEYLDKYVNKVLQI